jgi:glycosyltransferase involved in cell wall biosynthesis
MPDLTAKPTVSIVVPFHNEEDNVTELYARLHSVMEDVDWEYQFVFVDDGSTDLTYKRLRDLAAIDPRVTVVRLRRNFGQTAALAAGFAHCTCDCVIAMDGDLQHDPAEIPRFLEKLEEGYDVVSGWRKHRVDNLVLRKIPSRCANWLMAKLSGVNIHDFGTTFKAYRRELLSQLPLYGEMHRFIPALASAYGASICEIPIHNKHRKHGVSHYNLSRTFRVMFDLLTIRFLLRYMSRPLHFFGRLGLINMSAGSAVALWLLVSKVLYRTNVVEQHALLLVFAAVLVLLGVQLVALGLLAELGVWQYFNPAARKPYSVSEILDLRAAGGIDIASERRS